MTAVAKKIVTLGLASLKVADSVATGGASDTGFMPASGMAQQGNVYRDSFSLSTEDPTLNEFYAEELDNPVEVVGTLGKTTITFDILNPSVEDMEAWGFGTKDLTGAKQSIAAPKTWAACNKAIEVTPTKGYKIEVPNASVVSSVTGGGKKSEPMLLHVVATVMTALASDQSVKEPMILTEI